MSSIAILPFTNATGASDAEYLVDGITEAIINSLSEAPGLKVIARTSAYRFKGVRVEAQQAGQQPGVQAVLVGELSQHDDSLAVQADLVKVADGSEVWGEHFQRNIADIQSLQADIARQISEKLRLKLAGEQRQRLIKHYTQNNEAYLRTWGAQHWYANLSCYYEAIFASNRGELLDPVFDMYSSMYEASAVAARQQWGSEGIYIAETSYFNGLARLPEDIAAEMRDLYLLRKPWEERSSRFRLFAEAKHPHSSRWNWIQSGEWVDGKWVIKDRGFGPYGAVNHIFCSTAKICYYYWRRYEYTQDREWLRNRAYPMLRGAVEFYRHYPNLRKGEDGKYHIHHVNSNESVYGARDTDEDVSSMRGVAAALLRASEILGVDSSARPAWREFLDNLRPLPTSDDPQALKPAGYSGARVFVRGLKPAIKEGGFLPDSNSLPMWLFDFCNVESADGQVLETARNTLSAAFRNGISSKTPVSVLSKVAIAAASLGRDDAVRFLIPNQIRALTPERSTAYKQGGVLANRMTLREGPQAIDAQRLGRASEALHLALLQSNPPAPGEDDIIHVFPAWPEDWSAQYTLAARGGFLVRAITSAAVAPGRGSLKSGTANRFQRHASAER